MPCGMLINNTKITILKTTSHNNLIKHKLTLANFLATDYKKNIFCVVKQF